MLATLRDVLPDAQRRGYALGMFNTIDFQMVRAVIEAAEQERSSVIIGTAEALLPNMPLEMLAPVLLNAARRASVPVVVHLDHGLTGECVLKALSLGFSSVMMDCSTLPYEQNLEQTRDIVRIAAAFGASVEAELGHVGEAADPNDPDAAYTHPSQARNFVEHTGVDALAVAIGSAHGEYRSAPKLDLERLGEIRAATDAPLVLHGGSGLSDDDFKNSIRGGIAKINIFTDVINAAARDARKLLQKNPRAQYTDLMQSAMDSMRACVVHKMRLFSSSGKA